MANAFTVGLGADGGFDAYAYTGTHFIVDVTGYYAAPTPGVSLYYHKLASPVRLLDTRVAPGNAGTGEEKEEETASHTGDRPGVTSDHRNVTS